MSRPVCCLKRAFSGLLFQSRPSQCFHGPSSVHDGLFPLGISPLQCAPLHSSSADQAGHNKWSKIKRKKAVADMERSQYTHKYIQRVLSAVRTGGSADPEKNLRLASVIDQAKSAGVPKSNIDTAIQRASSKAGGESAESVLLDGRGPSGYFLLIEAVTNNIKRTKPQVKTLLEKNGASLGDPGSSAFNFEHKALVQVPTSSFPPSQDPLELAIEIGAEDVDTVIRDSNESYDKDLSGEEGKKASADEAAHAEEKLSVSDVPDTEYQFKCEINDLRRVLKLLREKGVVEKISVNFDYIPKSLVELKEEEHTRANRVVEVICAHEEVVEVYSNFVLSE